MKKGSEGLDISRAVIVDPATYEKTQAYIDKVVELRAKKGMTPEKAKETIMNDYTYYGVMMVKMGDADGIRCMPFDRQHPSSMFTDSEDKAGHKAGFRILCHGRSEL